ncbi:MAG: 2-octaprenyl-6-methoxyphenyl hydroxylase [Ectothiorhodospiraceae bacterium]|jgi:2-octaprenyl-6-methoxyphenol hydroxylase|nr:2-octaprenyl-6-methoxyphenyl hydroxylase [Ectothiorhodospiraceae bacterium]
MSDATPNTDFDVTIAGGGLVGATLGIALAGSGLRVAVIEAHAYELPGQPSYDDRATAVAMGSRRVFEGLGLWRELEADATPILRIHVSQRGHFGVTRMDHREEGVPALGCVVENRALGRVLTAALADAAVSRWMPARIRSFEDAGDRLRLRVDTADGERTLTTHLLVAADGSRSELREMAGIGVHETPYHQTAVIANVTPQRHHEHVAYERFTDDGPLALLPMSGGRCALVWTRPDDRLEETLALDDAAFLSELHARFGHRLGRCVKMGARASYPLSLLRAETDIAHRLVLVGNASHTIHPVSGQGLNLALRDVAVLTELLYETVANGGDPGDPALLERYQAWRRDDLDTVVRMTDALVRVFTNPWPGFGHLRGVGLVGMDLCPSLRHWFARQGMGLRGRLPLLARGGDLDALRAGDRT